MRGFRFFKCEECGHEFKEESEDCLDSSSKVCPELGKMDIIGGYYTHLVGEVFPHGFEAHPEWS
jgi:hypothetical protein